MPIIIATGTNIGDKKKNLETAILQLQKYLKLTAKSRIYTSAAVDYEAQPDFFNQVLEFETPSLAPEEVMKLLLKVEKELGRTRDTDKGPRTIDLDLIFYDFVSLETPHLTLPHPRAMDRSFVMLPLSELPFFVQLESKFKFPAHFNNHAVPIE